MLSRLLEDVEEGLRVGYMPVKWEGRKSVISFAASCAECRGAEAFLESPAESTATCSCRLARELRCALIRHYGMVLPEVNTAAPAMQVEWFAQCADASVCFVLLSEGYVHSSVCEGHITYATDNGVAVVPVATCMDTKGFSVAMGMRGVERSALEFDRSHH